MTCPPFVLLAAALLAPGVSVAQAEEWTCPPAAKVGMMAVAPGWIAYDTLMYPYQAPVLRLESMENSTHGPAAVCKYRIENSGLLSIWKLARCEHGKGTWKTSGPKSACESIHPAECSLLCAPVAGAAKPGG